MPYFLTIIFAMWLIISYNSIIEYAKETIMNREDEVLEIYERTISKEEKIRLLEDIALDLLNEMEAQDQNMHPEIHNKMSEGLQLAKNYIRTLRD
jgi:hypothetical protein